MKNSDSIKELKSFIRQMMWCMILMWIASGILGYFASDKLRGWIIVPIGAIIFTIIYFSLIYYLKNNSDEY